MDTFAMALLLSFTSLVHSHGVLLNPPARNSIWREGFANPPNYDDNGLNCGGYATQWATKGGRCAVCGDPFQGPLRHESGYPGGFANGIIGRHYKEGSTIEATAQITANHKGFISFKLCPVNDNSIKLTQECFDKYPLYNVTGRDKFYVREFLGDKGGFIKVSLVLPKGLRCSQCVIQWRYTAGHMSGAETTPQETFLNCADVLITKEGGQQPTPVPPLQPLKTVNGGTIRYDSDGKSEGKWDCDLVHPYSTSSDRQKLYYWCLDNCIRPAPEHRNCPPEVCECYSMDSSPQGATKEKLASNYRE